MTITSDVENPEKVGVAVGGGETTVASASSTSPELETEQAVVPSSKATTDGGEKNPSAAAADSSVEDAPKKSCKSIFCYDFQGSQKAAGFAYVRILSKCFSFFLFLWLSVSTRLLHLLCGWSSFLLCMKTR